MVVLALIILALAALFAVGAVAGGGADATLDVWIAEIGTTVAGVFLTGLVTGLVVLVGTVMLLAASRRARERRREAKVLRQRAESSRTVEEERDQLAAEKEQLERELRARREEEAGREDLAAERAQLRREMEARETTGTTRPVSAEPADTSRSSRVVDGSAGTETGPDQQTRA